MRSRFALTETPDRLSTLFRATSSNTSGWKPSYKFAPARKIIIVRDRPTAGTAADRELVTATWGFTPSWLSGEVPPIIRVGIERVLTNGYFHDAFLHRRCLVPLLGYYDWEEDGDGQLQSYFVRGGGEVLAAIGIYNERELNGRRRLSVAMVTHDTGTSVDDRVPTIVGESLWNEWLATDDRIEPEDLLRRVGSRSLEEANGLSRTRVGDSINSPYARDAVSLIAPARKRA